MRRVPAGTLHEHAGSTVRLAGGFERVYEVGPVFRAEPHDTARHLAQYTSLDVELGFITDHRDVMAVVWDVLAGIDRKSVV